MEPGYGSPIGAHDTVVVVDDLVARSPNLVAGANREGFHYRNVNHGRDFTPDVDTDITNAQEGDPCPTCGQPVILRNGIEVGNIFKLGTKYTDAVGATYLGEDGQAHPIVMGSYGIGVGRNVACIVEEHHDDKGIVWPAEVAPYAAHLVSIGAAKEPRVTEIAERLHALADRGGPRHEILWDDRDESPGVKFTDAELLGMPWILTVRRARWLRAASRSPSEDRRTLDPPDRGGRGTARERVHTRALAPVARDAARRHRPTGSVVLERIDDTAGIDRRPVERDDVVSAFDDLLDQLARGHRVGSRFLGFVLRLIAN